MLREKRKEEAALWLWLGDSWGCGRHLWLLLKWWWEEQLCGPHLVVEVGGSPECRAGGWLPIVVLFTGLITVWILVFDDRGTLSNCSFITILLTCNKYLLSSCSFSGILSFFAYPAFAYVAYVIHKQFVKVHLLLIPFSLIAKKVRIDCCGSHRPLWFVLHYLICKDKPRAALEHVRLMSQISVIRYVQCYAKIVVKAVFFHWY